MRTIKFFCVLLLLALPALAAPKPKPLFNGHDLDGWTFLGRDESKGFVVEDGILHTERGKGLLWFTKEKLGNGTLRVVFKMSNEKGNSGVFIRIPDAPHAESDAINKGIEVQIDDRDDDYHCTGTLYSMTKALARPDHPAGEWNTMEITLDGLRTIVKINGVLVTDYDGKSPAPPKVKSYEPDRGPRPEYGYIGLQKHDDVAVISFKEVSFAPKGR